MIRDKIERVMRGDDSPGVLGLPLFIMSSLYGAGVAVKNYAYDSGRIKSHKAPVSIISVGGVTIGGAGKTPVTQLLAEKLFQSGAKVGVLSRGYGSSHDLLFHVVSDGDDLSSPPPFSADEPYMMAKNLPGVPVVCAPDRVLGVDIMCEKFKLDVIILDDGYQRRSISRDLNILTMDAASPFGVNGKLFPRGVLREPTECIKRADLVVLTSNDTVSIERVEEIAKKIEAACGEEKDIVVMQGSVGDYKTVDDKTTEPPDGPMFLFSGIANPARFVKTVKSKGRNVVGFMEFPDHHQYTKNDIDTITAEAIKAGAKYLVTTEKDAVRLLTLKKLLNNIPILYLPYRLTITNGENHILNAFSRFM